MIFHVGRADEREVVLVRNREYDSSVDVLEDVCETMLEDTRYNDVAALHQPHASIGLRRSRFAEESRDPRPGRIDDCAARDVSFLGAAQLRVPCAILQLDPGTAGSRENRRPALGGVASIQHDQTRVVGPAVGIDEPAGVAWFQRRAGRVFLQVERGRGGEMIALCQVVI